jgi:enoyl-CoA hydratase
MLCDGTTRYTHGGINFKRRADEKGWKQAAKERDQGTIDWTTDEPMKSNR